MIDEEAKMPSDSLVQDTLRTGLVSAFVTKPFRHDELLNAIHAVLSTG